MSFSAAEAQEAAPRRTDRGRAGHGHDFHPNHVAAWVGGTTLESGATHFTLGGDYVRRLGSSGRWGIGGFGEVIFAEHSEWVFGALGSFFPTGELWLMTGLGLELFEEEREEGSGRVTGSSTEEVVTSAASFLVRFGLGYHLGLGPLTLTPSVFVDLVRDQTALVWGLGVGRGF